MKIQSETEQVLVLLEPNLTHKVTCIIFITIGLLGSLAVIASREGLHNGIILYLLLAAGIIGLKWFGKPDQAEFNKSTGHLTITTYEGAFSKPEQKKIELNEIKSAGMEHARLSNSNSSLSFKKSYNIHVTLKDDQKIDICPYTNRKKYREKALDKIKVFLGLEHSN